MDPLEFLAHSNDCMISDLRYDAVGRYDLAPLLAREAAEFTVAGWNALLQYILPGAPQVHTQTEAWTYLVRHRPAGTTKK